MTNDTAGLVLAVSLSGGNVRYKVVEGSQSAHCCFEFTVVDTTKPLSYATDQFDSVCECYTREDADTICTALNRVLLKGNPRPGLMGWAD